MTADLMHGQTKSRISFLLRIMPKDIRKALQNSKPNKLLFGENIPEKIKESRNWSRLFSAQTLGFSNQNKTLSRQLNFNGLRGTRPFPHHAGQQGRGRARSNRGRFQRPNTFNPQAGAFNQGSAPFNQAPPRGVSRQFLTRPMNQTTKRKKKCR